MNITHFKKLDNLSVIARFNLEFEDLGLTIRDCTLIKSRHGGMFVSMPSRKYEKDGKAEYFSYVVWTKEEKPQLDRQVIDKVKPLLEAEDDSPF